MKAAPKKVSMCRDFDLVTRTAGTAATAATAATANDDKRVTMSGKSRLRCSKQRCKDGDEESKANKRRRYIAM